MNEEQCKCEHGFFYWPSDRKDTKDTQCPHCKAEYKDLDRKDRCKCGRWMYWSTESKEVQCGYCRTKYKVDCDSVLVYWLKEIMPEQKPWTTEAR